MEWREDWQSAAVVNYTIVTDPTIQQPGFDLPRQSWSLLNRFRTGQGPCHAILQKWALAKSPTCSSGWAISWTRAQVWWRTITPTSRSWRVYSDYSIRKMQWKIGFKNDHNITDIQLWKKFSNQFFSAPDLFLTSAPRFSVGLKPHHYFVFNSVAVTTEQYVQNGFTVVAKCTQQNKN